MPDRIQNYLNEYLRAVGSLPLNVLERLREILIQAAEAQRTIYVCGNGGSAANADHFVCDLNMRAAGHSGHHFRAISLLHNVAGLTAAANDLGYADVFATQLRRTARPGDLLFCMSVSGDSPNIVQALLWGREHGMVTIGLGSRRRGRLTELAEYVVLVDDDNYGRVEDVHMQICHMLCHTIQER
jgi:D-sedoheptulose 7-phosphate isomerase